MEISRAVIAKCEASIKQEEDRRQLRISLLKMLSLLKEINHLSSSGKE